MSKGPAGGSAGGRGGSGAGAAPGIEGRQFTSHAVLRWRWDHPQPPYSGGQLVTPPATEALAALAGRDKRPLLVIRECDSCRGTDDAFLSRELDNEKTVILGRWFHAVKLAPDVVDPSHGFHALFEGAKPPHLFVATADGSLRIDLSGGQSQAQLWSAMTRVLKLSYVEDPLRAVSEMRKLLDKLDHLDSRIEQAELRLAEEAAAKGEDAPSVRKQKAALAKLHEQRTAALEKGAAIDELTPREPAEGAPAR